MPNWGEFGATRVAVYAKEACHLCENVIFELHKLHILPFEISTQDITKDAGLFERYKNIIPVVEVEGKIRLAGAALSNPSTLESTLRKMLLTS